MHHHAVQQLHRMAGGHHGHALEVQVQGLHHDEALEAHVAGGPGHGPDVFRQPGPKQHHRHLVQTHPGFRVRLSASLHPDKLTYLSFPAKPQNHRRGDPLGRPFDPNFFTC